MNFVLVAGLGQLSQGGVSMGGFGAGGLPQLAADLNPALPISSVASQSYQSHYPLNSLGKSMVPLLSKVVAYILHLQWTKMARINIICRFSKF